jgi:hypothetical protein
MSDGMLRCEDHDTLVSYLYDECAAGERARIRAHLDACARCAGEVAALAETRQQLLAWSPPAVPLDVRVTGSAGSAAARPVGGLRWWAQPLPAWAQVAAAGLIFAAGVSVGTSRVAAGVPPEAAVEAQLVAPAVAPEDLASIEERVRAALEDRFHALVGAELAAVRAAAVAAPVAAAAPVSVTQDALLREVQALIDRNEERQRIELAADLRVLQGALGTLGAQQRATLEDLVQQRRVLEQLAGQGQAIGYFARR